MENAMMAITSVVTECSVGENPSSDSPGPFPCLVFFHGLVTLWTHPKFLPVVVSEIHLNQEITLPVFLHRLYVSRLTNHSRMDVNHDLTLHIHGQALLQAAFPLSSVFQDHSFWNGSFYFPLPGSSLTPVHHSQDCSQPLGLRCFVQVPAWLLSGGTRMPLVALGCHWHCGCCRHCQDPQQRDQHPWCHRLDHEGRSRGCCSKRPEVLQVLLQDGTGQGLFCSQAWGS